MVRNQGVTLPDKGFFKRTILHIQILFGFSFNVNFYGTCFRETFQSEFYIYI